jgi:hypothetical protein
MQSKGSPKATLGAPAAPTGRDGAIDLAVKATGSPEAAKFDKTIDKAIDETDRFARVLGAAAIALWSDLPRSLQEQLFERAVVLGHHGEQDEMLREQLAKFLHDHHKRTGGAD